MNQIGVMGLGVMGSAIALNLATVGYQVALYNKTISKTEVLEKKSENFKGYTDIKKWIDSLEKPRKVLLMVSASAVDEVIDELLPLLEKDDILIDGGNSFYKDSERRMETCMKKGIYFIGMGISGGEEGALKGPSMMPSGDESAYRKIESILEKIAARTDEYEPCVTYVGQKGSGHFVKMVHNAIEYADMQLIVETYMTLKAYGYAEKEISSIFKSWNESRLGSYLLEISADILKYEEDKEVLVTKIKEKANHKGTGTWSSLVAIDHGIAIPSLIEALQARYLSYEDKIQITHTSKDMQLNISQLEHAFYLSKIIVYHQGFEFMKKMSDLEGWNLNLSELAKIWQKGCIIQSNFLEEVKRIYENHHDLLHDEQILSTFTYELQNLKQVSQNIIEKNIYAPVFLSTLSYINGLSKSMGMNLLQAQRDYFGAHTYERIDKKGVYHTDWKKEK